MKPIELSQLLDSFASYLEVRGGQPLKLQAISALIKYANVASVPALTKKIATIEPPHDGQTDNTVEMAIDDLAALASLLKQSGATGASKDIEAIRASLQAKRHLSLQVLLAHISLAAPKSTRAKAPPKQIAADVVERHIRLLEQALGDDAGFNTAMTNLETDPSVTTGELAAIAKRFAFATTKTRAAALKKIYSRHEALMTSRARSSATAGRVAG